MFNFPPRYTQVTLILDDGNAAIKRTFHKTDQIGITGLYNQPGLPIKDMHFEINFSAAFDHDKGSLYTEEVLPSRIKKAGYGEVLDAVRESEATESEMHSIGSHPDYLYETTEGPRKSWEDVDIPPSGDGWERNVDMGRKGWDRFDYTEESYWRRKKDSNG